MKMQPELCVDANIYDKAFPNFGRPKIVGYIGLENLKYAKQISNKKVSLDLNLHIEKAKLKPQHLDVKLTDLLKFLLENERNLCIPEACDLAKAQFLCYRGLMTCIACTPYEKREQWKVVAILYKGNIYLCARDTEEKISRINNMTEKEKRFTSWGYKFEQFMLSDRPDTEPNPDVPVDENEEFSVVFTTHLNRHTVVYGAEMDGIRCDKNIVSPLPEANSDSENVIQYLSNKEFIELKTNRHLEFPNQETSFRRFKTKKWWCQSFLVGIDTILCGFRNDAGIVEELKVFPVKELPKMSKRFWNPNVCFNFLDTFLTYVKRCLSREIKCKYGDQALNDLQKLPLISILFEWKPGHPVQVSQNYVYEDDPILPQWFLENYCKNER